MGTLKSTTTTGGTARQRYIEEKRKHELQAEEDTKKAAEERARKLRQKFMDLESASACTTCTADPVRHAIDLDEKKGNYTQRKLSQNLGRDVTDLSDEQTWELLKKMQVERVVSKKRATER